MTDRELHKLFVKLNERFFDNRIPPMSVRFKKLKGTADGLYTKDDIAINYDIRNRYTTVVIALLHEMVHADLHYDCYVGYEEDHGHGTRFMAGIDRLYRVGAYDGVL